MKSRKRPMSSGNLARKTRSASTRTCWLTTMRISSASPRSRRPAEAPVREIVPAMKTLVSRKTRQRSAGIGPAGVPPSLFLQGPKQILEAQALGLHRAFDVLGQRGPKESLRRQDEASTDGKHVEHGCVIQLQDLPKLLRDRQLASPPELDRLGQRRDHGRLQGSAGC